MPEDEQGWGACMKANCTCSTARIRMSACSHREGGGGGGGLVIESNRNTEVSTPVRSGLEKMMLVPNKRNTQHKGRRDSVRGNPPKLMLAGWEPFGVA